MPIAYGDVGECGKSAALYTPEGVYHMDSKDQYDDGVAGGLN